MDTGSIRIRDIALNHVVRVNDRGLINWWNKHKDVLEPLGFKVPVERAQQRINAAVAVRIEAQRQHDQRLAAKEAAERVRIETRERGLVRALASRMQAAAKSGNAGAMRAAHRDLSQPALFEELVAQLRQRNLTPEEFFRQTEEICRERQGFASRKKRKRHLCAA